MVLVITALSLSANVIAKKDLVSIDSAQLLHESKAGQALKAKLENEARELQAQQQALIAELQQAGQEFQKNAKLLSKSAQETEIARLRKMEARAQRTLQENNAEFQEAAKIQQEALHHHNLEVAANVHQENGWGLMVDKNSAVAVNPSIDVTKIVLEKLNQEYDAAQQNILVAQNASEEVVA